MMVEENKKERTKEEKKKEEEGKKSEDFFWNLKEVWANEKKKITHFNVWFGLV
jgi:hypothetical protein